MRRGQWTAVTLYRLVLRVERGPGRALRCRAMWLARRLAVLVAAFAGSSVTDESPFVTPRDWSQLPTRTWLTRSPYLLLRLVVPLWLTDEVQHSH